MNLFAIVVGWLADLFATFIFFGIVLSIVSGGDAVDERVIARMESPDLQFSTFIVGMAFTGVGGYVAALIAKRREVAHGVGVGVLAIGSSLGVFLAVDTFAFNLLSIASYVLTIPIAALGGWLRVPAATGQPSS